MKKNVFNIELKSYLLLFFGTLFVLYLNLNLHYLSTFAPDFQYYKDYISYFFRDYELSGREQGLLYFFLVSCFIKFRQNNFSFYNSNQLISNAIQMTNLALYLLGLFGLYFLLRHKGFTKKNILVAFSAINFFPQTINMILTMKPEILAFALLPWIMFFIILFFENRNYKLLYFSLIPVILLVTSKATIAASLLLIFVYILIKEKFNIFNKDFLAMLLLFTLLLTPVLIENFKGNGKHLYQHTYEVNWEPEIAEISFLYNINFHELYLDPFRHTHADSLLGIIVLDTFGDYFQWYAYDDQSIFMYIKKNFDPIWYITHWRQFFSVILTLCSYFLIFYFAKKDNKNKIFYLFPFFGLFILLLQAYGIPQKGFDKETAELFKTHYYSYLLIICLIFVILNLFKKNIIIGYSILLVFILTSAFLYGLPNKTIEYQEIIKSKNLNLDTCVVNSFLINNSDINDCFDRGLKICESNPEIYNIKNSKLNHNNNLEYIDTLTTQSLINLEGKIVTPKSQEECIELIKNGFYYDSIFLRQIKIPYFNTIYFMIFLLCIIYLINTKFVIK